ncbi:MAG: hypothetical protein BWY04_00440 [candidate division CPR1 bacterium ADurb.Bin160]|uniref:Uncharacterized protein n=1 Tax=candidate division CPR1 bacterium ADurb.Bin160 TaxID=1852826 RepID=A0A1V5ZPN3_9BACT|nr:MAG: hypothetical protein BWY04_00440 [candidate division CPR1 bacterium ADurb.Bin160]
MEMLLFLITRNHRTNMKNYLLLNMQQTCLMVTQPTGLYMMTDLLVIFTKMIFSQLKQQVLLLSLNRLYRLVH